MIDGVAGELLDPTGRRVGHEQQARRVSLDRGSGHRAGGLEADVVEGRELGLAVVEAKPDAVPRDRARADRAGGNAQAHCAADPVLGDDRPVPAFAVCARELVLQADDAVTVRL